MNWNWLPWNRRRPLPDLTEYQGQWVCIKKNRVVATAASATEMLTLLRDEPRRYVGCKVEYEPRPEEVQLWAVIYENDKMRPGPNCRFVDRANAERWIRSHPNTFNGKHKAQLAHREHHRDPWQLVSK